MVLDWFHITKRFTIINNRVDDDFEEELEKVKWFLWHGNPEKALTRLRELELSISKKELSSDLQELYGYIDRNQCYIANYSERQKFNLPFSSTIAESSVNEVINTRQKNNKKMQWSREGAHNILQIRTSKFSKTWEHDWKKAQEKIYTDVA